MFEIVFLNFSKNDLPYFLYRPTFSISSVASIFVLEGANFFNACTMYKHIPDISTKQS